MKKLLLLFSMMALAFNAYADNVLSVDDIRVRPGGRATIAVKYLFDSEHISGYQFDVQLPDGISRGGAAKNGETIDATWTIGSNNVGIGHFRLATFSYGEDEQGDPSGNIPITDHEGVMVYIPITADESLTDGTVLQGQLFDIILPENTGGNFKLQPITFNIIIDSNAGYTDLYETEEAAPEDANDVDVRVYRTFTDGEWSTICLPFDMTEDQVKAAFGDGVELGDFVEWEAVENDKGDVSSINVSFDPVTAIEANHPYIIKTAAATYPFIVEKVNIAAEEEPVTEVRHSSRIRSYMYGTYIANTIVPDLGLFLSGNKFWYSTGKTKMKAFRAYFELFDVLTSVETVGAKIFINYDGNPTSIEGVRTVEDGNNDIYSVSGQYMGKDAKRLQRGVYIVNGKKVVKK
jgi:hypothetical protein